MVGFTAMLAPGAHAAYTVRLIPADAAGDVGDPIPALKKWNVR